MSINIERCKRCNRWISETDLTDGLCNACHSGAIPQEAVDLAKQLRALPEEADLYAWAQRIAAALETELHKRFADKRGNGEWFKLSDADLDYIRSLVPPQE